MAGGTHQRAAGRAGAVPEPAGAPRSGPAGRAVLPRVAALATLIRAAALLLVLAMALAGLARPGQAQVLEEAAAPDFAAWEVLAGQAEDAITDRSSPSALLEELRAQVVAQRSQFQNSQSFNSDRIDILREQIEALGAPPGEGETEAPEIAERRADLAARLAQRQAPLVAADEAFRRADAIVRSIDRVLRERQADALMELSPTPLNPANWRHGANTLISSLMTVWGEIYNAWLDPAQQAAFFANLPVTLGSLVLAATMILRGRSWLEEMTARLMRSNRILRGRSVAAFLLSLVQISVAASGLVLLYTATISTGLTGPTIDALSEALLSASLILAFSRWLSLLVFPVAPDQSAALNLDEGQRRRGRRLALWLAFWAGVLQILHALIQPELQPPGAVSALSFPLIALGSIMLFRMGKLLWRHRPTTRLKEDGTEDPGAGPGFFDRVVFLGAKALIVISVAGVVLAAIGYIAAAQQIVIPAGTSLAVIGLAVTLHRLVVGLYETVTGNEEEASNALVPALAGLVFALGSIPLLAMAWGLRVAELLEIWQRFREGFTLGGARISPASILSFILIFVIGYVITRGVQGALASSVLPKTRLERGAQKAIISGLGYVGIIFAALAAFSFAGIDLSGLAIVAGALSVGIGFGLQNIVSNFVAGVILLIERPVSEGDWIEVGPNMGIVSRIAVRSTVIETFDKSELIVPNSDLISLVVTNYTKSNRTGRLIVPVSVSITTDPQLVLDTLRDIVEAHPVVAMEPAPMVMLMSFGENRMNFEIRAILRDVFLKFVVMSELNVAILNRFVELGIEVARNQSDLHIRHVAQAEAAAALTGQPEEPDADPPPDQPAVPDDTDSSPSRT